jgi:nucleoside-diphosphate kinase
VAEQRTLVLIKPDAVRRGLIGEVLLRLERKGLRIEQLRLRSMDAALSDAHYEGLKGFMTSGPLVSLVVAGDEAIPVVRKLAGATDGRKAEPGTIRGDFSISNQQNLIHASDSEESAKREIDLWFAA